LNAEFTPEHRSQVHRPTAKNPERSDAGRFIVRAEQDLTAFLELESAIHTDRRNRNRIKYWEIIADNLSKAGWSWGCVSGSGHACTLLSSNNADSLGA